MIWICVYYHYIYNIHIQDSTSPTLNQTHLGTAQNWVPKLRYVWDGQLTSTDPWFACCGSNGVYLWLALLAIMAVLCREYHETNMYIYIYILCAWHIIMYMSNVYVYVYIYLYRHYCIHTQYCVYIYTSHMPHMILLLKWIEPWWWDWVLPFDMLPYHFHIEMKLATVMTTTPQQPISTPELSEFRLAHMEFPQFDAASPKWELPWMAWFGWNERFGL